MTTGTFDYRSALAHIFLLDCIVIIDHVTMLLSILRLECFCETELWK